jgi:hypothetical protein
MDRLAPSEEEVGLVELSVCCDQICHRTHQLIHTQESTQTIPVQVIRCVDTLRLRWQRPLSEIVSSTRISRLQAERFEAAHSEGLLRTDDPVVIGHALVPTWRAWGSYIPEIASRGVAAESRGRCGEPATMYQHQKSQNCQVEKGGSCAAHWEACGAM